MWLFKVKDSGKEGVLGMRKLLAITIGVAMMAPGLTAAPPAAALDAATCGILGGGAGYQDQVQLPPGETEHVVSDLNELRSAVSSGAEYIKIPGDAVIDIPNEPNTLTIPNNVKIYSDRGQNGSQGGLLRIAQGEGSTADSWAVIQSGSSVRLSSLRFQGPSTSVDAQSFIIGIQARDTADNIEVDNSELWGFTWSPVSLASGSSGNTIHHNYIHHNQRATRGYGVVVQTGSTAELWCNAFNANRHAIAGSGEAGDGYTAYQNLALGIGNGHSFDMHQGSSGTGGKYVYITDNWFAFEPSPFYASIKVLGIPTDGIATISGNHFSASQIDGSNYRAVQGSGVPSGGDLRASNTFDSHISVVNDGQPDCSLTVGAVSVARVTCDVLEPQFN